MKIFLSEIRKLFRLNKITAYVLVLLLSSVWVCAYLTRPDPFFGRHTGKQIKITDEFLREYSDPEKFELFRQTSNIAGDMLNNELTAEYNEAVAKGIGGYELKRMFPQERYETYTYSDKVSDRILKYYMFLSTEAANEFKSKTGIIMDQAMKNAAILRSDMSMTADDPLYQYQIYVYNTYKNVADNVDEDFGAVCGWDKLLTYTYTDIFVFAAVILIVSGVYFVDRQSGMTGIIRASRNGRSRTALAKTGVVLSSSVAVTLMFSICTLLTVFATCGLSGGSRYIQNISTFAAFPFPVSVLGYYLYGLLLKILSMCAFAALCSLIAVLTQNQLVFYGASGVLFGVMFFFSRLSPLSYPVLSLLNLYSVCSVLPLSLRLYVMQPFVSCASYYHFAPVFCLLITVFASVLCVILFGGVRAAARKKSSKLSSVVTRIRQSGEKAERKRRYGSSVFSWECRKTLFGTGPVVIIIAAALLIHTGICVALRINSRPDLETKIYTRLFLPEVKGKFSDNAAKINAMLSLMKSSDAEKYDELVRIFIDMGAINAEEAERTRKIFDYINRNMLSDRLTYTYDTFNRNNGLYKSGLDPWFIDETGVRPLISNDLTYPLYFAILIVCISCGVMEYTGKSKNEYFANILKTTPNGRKKTFISKIAACTAVSAVLTVIFNITEFAVLTAGRDLNCMNAPVCSVSAFAETNLEMPVIRYILVMYVSRIVISVLFSVFVLSVTLLTRNLNASFAACAGATLLPSLLYRSGAEFAGYASFCDQFSVSGMILFSVSVFRAPFEVFTVYASVFSIAVLMLVGVSALRFIKCK